MTTPSPDYRGTADLSGGSGKDFISSYGSSSANVLLGGDGADDLEGSAGEDLPRGGPGDDFYYGGAGDDSLICGGGLTWFLRKPGDPAERRRRPLDRDRRWFLGRTL
jgi:Ca2+-binding RTX toxin-like protein